MSTPDFRKTAYQEGDYYVAQCLDIDISSFGTTEPEALANLHEAIELHLEEALGQPNARREPTAATIATSEKP
jgi:predicted RNase H-like HicB family nuclease